MSGLNPVWHDTLEFKVHIPELAFVVFTVFTKNLPVAHYALPYRCIQQGNQQSVIADLFYAFAAETDTGGIMFAGPFCCLSVTLSVLSGYPLPRSETATICNDVVLEYTVFILRRLQDKNQSLYLGLGLGLGLGLETKSLKILKTFASIYIFFPPNHGSSSIIYYCLYLCSLPVCILVNIAVYKTQQRKHKYKQGENNDQVHHSS